jgi:hypothetical protein
MYVVLCCIPNADDDGGVAGARIRRGPSPSKRLPGRRKNPSRKLWQWQKVASRKKMIEICRVKHTTAALAGIERTFNWTFTSQLKASRGKARSTAQRVGHGGKGIITTTSKISIDLLSHSSVTGRIEKHPRNKQRENLPCLCTVVQACTSLANHRLFENRPHFPSICPQFSVLFILDHAFSAARSFSSLA